MPPASRRRSLDAVSDQGGARRSTSSAPLASAGNRPAPRIRFSRQLRTVGGRTGAHPLASLPEAVPANRTAGNSGGPSHSALVLFPGLFPAQCHANGVSTFPQELATTGIALLTRPRRITRLADLRTRRPSEGELKQCFVVARDGRGRDLLDYCHGHSGARDHDYGIKG